jgi:hypothetical protein
MAINPGVTEATERLPECDEPEPNDQRLPPFFTLLDLVGCFFTGCSSLQGVVSLSSSPKTQ